MDRRAAKYMKRGYTIYVEHNFYAREIRRENMQNRQWGMYWRNRMDTETLQFLGTERAGLDMPTIMDNHAKRRAAFNAKDYYTAPECAPFLWDNYKQFL